MIRFDSVSKAFPGGQRAAVTDLTFEVERGEFVFLVGPSGSGKSTVLRLVLREDVPSSGDVHVLGQDLRAIPGSKVPHYRRNLGMVFQDFRLLPQKTVRENVAYALQVLGRSRGLIAEAVPDVLKTVGLAGMQDRFPHELSGGEQQRVAIARAVVNRPAILLADEPTGNLDPDTSRGIMKLLSRINANGTTVVMATHDQSIVDEHRLRVIELAEGAIVRDERSGVYQPELVEPAQAPVQGAVRESSRRRTIADSMADRITARDLGLRTPDGDAGTDADAPDSTARGAKGETGTTR
ncbi:cell division ATP-binding protein FtsE [Pseudoclavibacter endophyticus]|uniref:Cell division ATP-binding protein FtsE n=1 Tax=Pseudoclavibacter endophyticus TaxID=1778590 RepID=A0A6H9WUG3_9MICO|nr:cell division ATP-binding protein FtsE [Pseudoclavibacter endophyticus]KAB1649820.1 cell division ATP-binding protein FtsE [Pseudoclavibacter endophyticus]GGA59503.1 cell division ATP-binding protein FtsE [Pseudoclavibacter endophyticus]